MKCVKILWELGRSQKKKYEGLGDSCSLGKIISKIEILALFKYHALSACVCILLMVLKMVFITWKSFSSHQLSSVWNVTVAMTTAICLNFSSCFETIMKDCKWIQVDIDIKLIISWIFFFFGPTNNVIKLREMNILCILEPY